MELGVAPVIVVLDGQALSQIKIKQLNKRLAVVGTEFRGANYVKIAEASGARGTAVGTEAESAGALKEALHSAHSPSSRLVSTPAGVPISSMPSVSCDPQ
jgi:thiamine pyrophosphate-dependent acetolactate synthase large subunit-like protein